MPVVKSRDFSISAVNRAKSRKPGIGEDSWLVRFAIREGLVGP